MGDTEAPSRGRGLTAEKLQLLQSQLASEPRDAPEERQIRDNLSAAASLRLRDVNVQLVECSTEICRVDLSSRLDIETELLADEVTSWGPHGGIVISTNKELVGEHSAIIFMARYGKQLTAFNGAS